METVVEALQKEGIGYADLVALLLDRSINNQLEDRVNGIIEDVDTRFAQRSRQKEVLTQIPLVASVWGYRETPIQVPERPLLLPEDKDVEHLRQVLVPRPEEPFHPPFADGELPTIYELFRRIR